MHSDDEAENGGVDPRRNKRFVSKDEAAATKTVKTKAKATTAKKVAAPKKKKAAKPTKKPAAKKSKKA